MSEQDTVEQALRELERIEAQTRNARLDWALQSDEPCDLITDLARACEIARMFAAGAQGEREAWEAGFRLAVDYGDNWVHFDGEQKERQWQGYLSRRSATTPDAPQREAERR